MRIIGRLIGKILYFATLPAILIAVRNSTRTRVLVRCGQKFLVLKPWLGSDEWMLPGGGLHRGEEPLAGAIREVREETGLRLLANNMQYLGLQRAQEKRCFQYDYHLYLVEIPVIPALKLQRLEVRAADWLTPEGIRTGPSVNETTIKCIKKLP